MVLRGEIMKIAGCVYYFMDTRITKLNYLTRFDINKMIMLTALISPFKLSHVFTELVLDNKAAIEQ